MTHSSQSNIGTGPRFTAPTSHDECGDYPRGDCELDQARVVWDVVPGREVMFFRAPNGELAAAVSTPDSLASDAVTREQIVQFAQHLLTLAGPAAPIAPE